VILVTGGSGFLGGALVRALAVRGAKVRSVQRRDVPELRALGVECVQADLSDRAAVERAFAGAEAVFHVAARAGVWGTAQQFHDANVVATDNVLAACRTHAIRKLVYTSTPSVVHSGGDIEGADETLPVPAQHHHPYPATKACAEALVLAANAPGLSTVALRPHLIWGPGDTQLTARVIDRARNGRLRLVGGGLKKVDGLYIDNAVEAHLQALERLAPGAACAGKAYFLAQGEPVPQRELINGMLAAAGLPPCERSLSPRAASLVGLLLEGTWKLFGLAGEPPLTAFVANQLATAHWYDLSAARRDLGYAPRISTAQGLERLRQSLQAGQPPAAGPAR
jgi:nucleoside-diphosphate-sugar epimerase